MALWGFGRSGGWRSSGANPARVSGVVGKGSHAVVCGVPDAAIGELVRIEPSMLSRLRGAGTICQSTCLAALCMPTLIVATMPPDLIMSCRSMLVGRPAASASTHRRSLLFRRSRGSGAPKVVILRPVLRPSVPLSARRAGFGTGPVSAADGRWRAGHNDGCDGNRREPYAARNGG